MKTATHNSTEPLNGALTQTQRPQAQPPSRHRRPGTEKKAANTQHHASKRRGEFAYPRFKTRPTKQIAAGGVIYRHKDGQVEILFLKREDGRWTFPKGKQRLGESYVVAAIREIREETGIAGLRFVAPLGYTAFRYTERHEGPKPKPIAKTVHFFLFEAPATAQVKLPGSEGIVDYGWVRADRAFATLSYRNMDRLLAKALRLIVDENKSRNSP